MQCALPSFEMLQARAQEQGLDVAFHDGVDHLDQQLRAFR